ncbi:MAG: ATP-binding protein [Pirellulales bacterium]|nr:ATP-binding protein [Pirellulales bacterium]
MIQRHITEKIVEALADTPAVYLQGPRQAGKSTLAQAIAALEGGRSYYSLDSAVVLAAAQNDPEGFIAGLDGPVVLDEVQRAPALGLAIKAAIDRDRRPGRFLLTGSSNILALTQTADALVGRLEFHTLLPFSQGELAGRRESFFERAFAQEFVSRAEASRGGVEDENRLIERMLVGGYPEAVARPREDRRRAWFDSYLSTILDRDVRDWSNIERLAEIPRLLTLLATRIAQLHNQADLARSLKIPQSTLKRYLAILERAFLACIVPAWHSNLGKRLVKAPKLGLVDTALACHLLGLDAERLRENRSLFGQLLENFVLGELMKQKTWAKISTRLYHFRTAAGKEVDWVLEDAAGNVVGIEVKSSVSLSVEDFRGLGELAQMAGPKFRRGLLLHRGEKTVPFAENCFAVPLEELWE